MEYVEVRSLTKEALKEWLLQQGVPQEQVDAFHGMLIVKRMYIHIINKQVDIIVMIPLEIVN